MFVGVLVAQIYVDLTYAADMPRVPQPEAGRTRRISVNHGTIVYVTQVEYDRANFVLNQGFYAAAVIVVLAAAVNIYWKPF